MKRIIIISLIVFCISCKNDVKPTIKKEFLKSDWIITDTAFLFVEDSLVLFSEIQRENYPIYKYTISNDTLFLSPVFNPFQRERFKAVFKILELTENNFHLKFISSSIYRFNFESNRKFFFKRDTIIKNNKTLRNLEFSSSTGMGGRTPTLDMKIDNDSTIYIMYYRGVYGIHGLFQHKLTGKEFDRINRKFKKINLDSMKLGGGIPDASFFTYILNTKDSMSYKYAGCLFARDNQKDLENITAYLTNLILLLKTEKSNLDTLLIQQGLNRERINFGSKNYAP